MKTPSIRTQPSGGGASGAPEPAASAPGSADPAVSASPYDYGGGSGAPAGSGEYTDKNDEYAAP